ncbi:MAG TPA: TMEM175 family protein [Acidimicrobiia bacterium]
MARTYERGREEFGRVLAFSDGLFAIAMTLLVVGIGVPTVQDAQLGNALRDLLPEIISFFVSFLVVGYYWLAHHRFFAQLRHLTTPLIVLNLVYLAAIAFVPFPTALVGKYENEPVSVIMYAVTLGTASFLEAAMLVAARRGACFHARVPDDLYRFALIASMLPVVVFAISIPISLASTSWALYSWLLIFPLEHLADRWRPATTGDVLS